MYTDIINDDGLADDYEFTMTAMSNGVMSRPVKFRKGARVAPIMNLVINLEQGLVTSLKWSNSCYDN